MTIAPSILLHASPRGRLPLALQLSSPSYQGLLKLRFFLPSSLARLSVAAVRSASFSGAAASTGSPAGETTLSTAHQLGQKVGRAAACRALNVPRASLYRHLRPIKPTAPPAPRPSPPRALASAEHQRVLEVLNSQRFCDKPPAEVFATPLDEGTDLCSIRTIYRILEQASELSERRDQLRHPNYQKTPLRPPAQVRSGVGIPKNVGRAWWLLHPQLA